MHTSFLLQSGVDAVTVPPSSLCAVHWSAHLRRGDCDGHRLPEPQKAAHWHFASRERRGVPGQSPGSLGPGHRHPESPAAGRLSPASSHHAGEPVARTPQGSGFNLMQWKRAPAQICISSHSDFLLFFRDSFSVDLNNIKRLFHFFFYILPLQRISNCSSTVGILTV